MNLLFERFGNFVKHFLFSSKYPKHLRYPVLFVVACLLFLLIFSYIRYGLYLVSTKDYFEGIMIILSGLLFIFFVIYEGYQKLFKQ